MGAVNFRQVPPLPTRLLHLCPRSVAIRQAPPARIRETRAGPACKLRTEFLHLQAVITSHSHSSRGGPCRPPRHRAHHSSRSLKTVVLPRSVVLCGRLSVSSVCRLKVPQTKWIKTTEVHPLTVRRPEIQDQVVGRAKLPPRLQRDWSHPARPALLGAAGRPGSSLALVDTPPWHLPCLHATPSLCECVPSYKDTLGLDLGSVLMHCDLILI